MGKAMKAMKAMKSGVKKKVKNESPEKGHSPGKGQPKGILKRPSTKPSLPLPNDPGLSLMRRWSSSTRRPMETPRSSLTI